MFVEGNGMLIFFKMEKILTGLELFKTICFSFNSFEF